MSLRTLTILALTAAFVTAAAPLPPTTGNATTTVTEGRCTAQKPFVQPFNQPYWNGWGNGLTQTRYQNAAMARLSADQVPRLKLKWAFGFPNAGRAYGQPAVAGGRVFVGSENGNVYSLDAQTGCVYWSFDAGYPVRTAITIGPYHANWAVYFGDQHATVYALDAAGGQLLWKTTLDQHPAAVVTGAPTLADGKLFVPMSSYEELTGASPQYECCKFRGSISALDALSGKILWKSYTIAQKLQPVRKNKVGTQLWGPAGAAVWSSPTIDAKKRLLYATTGNDYADPPTKTSDAILAFDLTTGKLRWSRQMTANDARTIDCDFPAAYRSNCAHEVGPDFDFGSSPILVNLPNGRRALIAGQKSGIVWAVDPDRRGASLWQRRVGKGGSLGGVQWGSAVDHAQVYIALSDVQLESAKAGTPGARQMFGGFLLYNPDAGGGLFALTLQSGRVKWTTPNPGCNKRPGCSPAQSAAVTAIPGAVFSGGLDGHLRAYAAADGKILWDVDTEHEYQTIDAVKAKGGSIDGPGPVVVDGMLFANSGSSFLGGTPGNVLLAFSVDGR